MICTWFVPFAAIRDGRGALRLDRDFSLEECEVLERERRDAFERQQAEKFKRRGKG